MTVPRLQQLWDYYIQAEHSSYEKSAWLDVFLAEFLVQVKEGKDADEIISCCSSSGGSVATLVGCALLSEVHALCLSPGEDLRPLAQLLLRGWGWRALALLHHLNCSSLLSCGHELCALLVSLFPVGLEAAPRPYIVREQVNPFVCISGPQPAVDKLLLDAVRSRGLGLEPTLRGRSATANVPATSSVLAASDSSSESNGETSEPPNIIRIRLNPMDFDYFTSVVRSDDEGLGLIPASSSSNSPSVPAQQQVAPDPDALRHDARLQECVQTPLSGYELSLLVLGLLQKLAPRSSATALSAANMCARRLCGRGPALAPGAELGETREWELRARLVGTLLATLPATLTVTAIPATLRSGLLPLMVKVLEDVTHRTSAAVKFTEDDGSDDESVSVCGSMVSTVIPITAQDAQQAQDVVYGMSLGVLVFVRGILIGQRGGSPDRLRDALELLELFSQGGGGRLIELSISVVLAIPFVDSRMSSCRACRLVDQLACLVSALKRARSEAAQHAARRSRRSSVPSSTGGLLPSATQPTHHHAPDPLGAPYCRVAAVFTSLVRLLGVPAVRERVLRAMAQCGTCCCFQPQAVVGALVETLRQAGSSSRVRRLVFSLLERTLYRELGAIVTDRDTPCPICRCQSQSSEFLLDSTDGLSGQGEINSWSCVELFRPLLEGDIAEMRLSQAVTSHLLRQVKRFVPSVKHQLLLRVFLPTFLAAKQRYLDQQFESDKLLVSSCLSALVSLLSSSMLLAGEFAREQGLEHIRQLVSLSPFTRSCCTLLKIAAAVDMWRISFEAKERGDSDVDILEQVRELPALVLLHQHTGGMAQRLLAHIASAGCQTPEIDSLLGDCVTFWRSVADLAMHSPLYRQLLANTPSVDVHNFMIALLKAGTEECGLRSRGPLYFSLCEAVLLCNLVSTSDVSGVINTIRQEVLGSVANSTSNQTGDSNHHWLCKVLLQCAIAESSPQQLMPLYSGHKLIPQWEEQVVSEEDMEEDADSGGGSSSYVTADEGYEADVEIPPQTACSYMSYSGGNGSFGLPHNHHRHHTLLAEPQLCVLAVDILIQLPLHQQASQEAVQVLQQLATLCRDNSENCSRLANVGMISQLLKGYGQCLQSQDLSLKDLQKVILELVVLLAPYGIGPDELSLYLSFFKADEPPLELLLTPLVHLANSSRPHPNHTLHFPCGDVDKLESLSVPSHVEGTGNDGAATALVLNFSQQHRSTGVITAWSIAALSLPVSPELGWSMWLQGYSLAMWLRTERPCLPPATSSSITSSRIGDGNASTSHHQSRSQSSSSASDVQHPRVTEEWNVKDSTCLLHVVSVGYESLILETWINTGLGTIHLQLTRPDNSGSDVISQATVDTCLSPGDWHHLAMNVRDYMKKRKNVIEVEMLIDGCERHECVLSFSGLLVRKARASAVLVGHAGRNDGHKGSWQFAGLQLFRSPSFTRERAIHLVGLGPGLISLADCDVGRASPNFTHVFGPQSLSSGVDWDSLLQSRGSNLKELQDNILMSFTAQNPNAVSLFPQTATNSGGPLFPVQPGYRTVSMDQRASQQPPVAVAPLLLVSQLNVRQYKGLLSAATLLGGIPVFLFLFARVVEMTTVEEVQAQALLLLLRLAQGDCELFGQFVGQECYKLLLKILRSSRCSAGHPILKAVLDACCDKPVLGSIGGDPSHLSILSHTDAVIVNSFVLRAVAGAWSAWGPGGSLPLLLRALHVLLRDDHPHREFNAGQMNRARIVDALLLFCKEQFLQEKPEYELEPAVCCSLVELVRSLMGAPPEFSHVVAVADFLLLSHPARHTYVSHARSNFYFLIDSNVPGNVSGMNSISEWRWRNRKETAFLTRAVDPLKLNKALANLQIKQRKELMNSNRMMDSGNFLKVETTESYRLSPISNSLLARAEDAVQLMQQGSNPMRAVEAVREKFVAETEEQMDKFAEGDSVFPSADGPGVVMEGLLLLLRDVLLVLPDNMAPQVLNHVVCADTLLVTANHPDVRVRTAVVKALSAYLQRSSEEELSRFTKLRGYQLLACQLAQWPASRELAEAVVTLGTRCPLPLEEQAGALEAIGGTIPPSQIAAMPPLMALLPQCCVSDVTLAHTLLIFLRQFTIKIMQQSATVRPMLDIGVVECLCRCLQAVPQLHLLPSERRSSRSGYDTSDPELLVSDIHLLLGTIISHSILLPGHQNSTQVLSDMLYQLGYMWEHTGGRLCRDAQFSVLESALDVLVERLGLIRPRTAIVLLGGHMLQSGLSNSYKEIDTLSLSTNSTSSGFSLSLLRDVGRNDLADRFRTVVSRAIEIISSAEVWHMPSETEQTFCRRLLSLMLPLTVERGVPAAVRDASRSQCSQLICWLLAPWQMGRVRAFAVRALLCQEASNAREVIVSLINSQAAERKLTLFLWDLLQTHATPVSEKRAVEELLARMTQWGLTNGPLNPENVVAELAQLRDEATAVREAWLRNSQPAFNRSVFRLEGLARQLSESAMAMTRRVVEAQNAERKSFMEHIKAHFSEDVRVRARWLRLRQALTHERAIWYFPQSYPRSWQLDPTEGPARVRNRLQRCHLGIDRRYLLPSVQDKIGEVPLKEPLSYLLEREPSQQQPAVSTVMIERLHTNEKIRHMSGARIVTPAREVPGEALIGESCIYFVADCDSSTSGLSELTPDEADLSSTAWHFDDVCEIHNRRYQLQERAVEIFLLNGKTYLVAFQSSKERDEFANELSQCRLPNRVHVDNLSDAIQLWREGLLTNWEYLSQLNKMAGRSYNDLMQYPVMPFVLADYTSNILDLKNPRSYRDFRRPMAVQEKKNEQHYINNYNYLKQELAAGARHISLNQEPYHYGSHYSNSGTVLHFLVRLPPFTRMFLTYQDNNFDLPDRTFHSLHTTWRLTSSDSATDVKELVPEFFFLPEFLLNSEGFNLGVRQSGQRVHHVQLPPWAGGDPRKFILIHRQALESDWVRENLPHWIDLVFGYKQTGKAAIDAVNVFHPATYYGFDVESIRDPLERAAWETMVRTYGQTPRQLFRSAHPMVVQALSSKNTVPRATTLQIEDQVRGLQWGNYVGSPGEPDPCPVWQHVHKVPISCLIPLSTNDVYGLAANSSLLISYSKDRGLGVINGTSVRSAALLSWGHPDGVVRVKLKKEQPPWPVISTPGIDPVCVCASAPEVSQLWLGHVSGRIQVLRFRLDGTLEFRPDPAVLLGHTDVLTAIVICRSFSIVVSAGRDGSAIIWDLNSLLYVRSVDVGAPITLAAVSRTLGDIVLATELQLLLFSVNAAPVGSVTPPSPTTAVCFSGAPEGISINAVASGHVDGIIRLWSSWDLSPLRSISCNSLLSQPIISVTYSHDCLHLYASAANGLVVIWEGVSTKGAGRTPKFLNLTSL